MGFRAGLSLLGNQIILLVKASSHSPQYLIKLMMSFMLDTALKLMRILIIRILMFKGSMSLLRSESLKILMETIPLVVVTNQGYGLTGEKPLVNVLTSLQKKVQKV